VVTEGLDAAGETLDGAGVIALVEVRDAEIVIAQVGRLTLGNDLDGWLQDTACAVQAADDGEPAPLQSLDDSRGAAARRDPGDVRAEPLDVDAAVPARQGARFQDADHVDVQVDRRGLDEGQGRVKRAQRSSVRAA
jgi:hypothetical protein